MSNVTIALLTGICLIIALLVLIWAIKRFANIGRSLLYAKKVTIIGDTAFAGSTPSARAQARGKLEQLAFVASQETNPYINSHLLADVFRSKVELITTGAHLQGDMSEADAFAWRDKMFGIIEKFKPGLPKEEQSQQLTDGSSRDE